MSNQISREEQLKITRERMYQIHGLHNNSGIVGTFKTIWYLTAGYFTNYDKHRIYVDTLKFVMEKQEQEEEKEEEKEEEN